MLRVVATALVLALSSPAARALEEFGLELPPGARKIGDHRFQVDRGFEPTVKFFREKFRGSKNVRWLREVSVPGVKYVHVQNTNESSSWDGINISQLSDGSVRLYFLERRRPAATTTTPAPSTVTPAKPAPASPASPR
jgi:hypothetical protein